MKTRRRQSLIVRFTWLLFWLFVIATTGTAGIAVGGLLGYLAAQPPLDRLEYYAPPQVTRVLDRTGRSVVANFATEKRELVAISAIPQRLVDAFRAVEDYRFYEHFGVDPIGLARAMWTNLMSGSMRQGGSTITQQLPRNVMSDTVSRDRKLDRKITEALMAFQIEQHFSKDQILEFYLNHIEFGQRSFGIQSAAQTYFGKNIQDLTVGECAMLAALPKAPTRYNPLRYPERALNRRNVVLERMREEDLIDEDTCDREKAKPLNVTRGVKPRITAPYFYDHLERTIEEDPDFKNGELTRGGYKIYSTMDMEYQRILEEELPRGLPAVERMWQEAKEARLARERDTLLKAGMAPAPKANQNRLARIIEVKPEGLVVDIEGYRAFAPYHREMAKKKWTGRYIKPYFDAEKVLVKGKLIDVHVDKVFPASRKMNATLLDRTHVQGAAALLDAQTGEILALTGGADYYDSDNNGMFNRATLGARQPGSSFKPFLYAIAMDHQRTAGTVIVDREVTYPGDYKPRNYENKFFGETALIEALSDSRNVVTVELFRTVGVQRVLQGYRRFDVTKPTATWTLRPELSLCLGSLDATPLSIGAAYLAFTNKGVAREPLCITKVTDLQGKIVKEYQPRQEVRSVSPQAAYITTCMLMEAMRHGTGYPIYKEFDPAKTPEMAGKTGTTSYNVDAWFVGFTPDLVLAVCVGFDVSRSLGPKMTGARVAGPIWTKMFKRILATRNNWKMKFDVPSDIVFRDISASTGLLIPPGNPNGEKVIAHAPFVRGTEPRAISEGSSYAAEPDVPSEDGEVQLDDASSEAPESGLIDEGTEEVREIGSSSDELPPLP